MKVTEGGTSDVVSKAIEREMSLVRDAVAMVASGRAPRMVVANLRFGESILELASIPARNAGVRVVLLWSTDDSNSAIAVERIDD